MYWNFVCDLIIWGPIGIRAGPGGCLRGSFVLLGGQRFAEGGRLTDWDAAAGRWAQGIPQFEEGPAELRVFAQFGRGVGGVFGRGIGEAGNFEQGLAELRCPSRARRFQLGKAKPARMGSGGANFIRGQAGVVRLGSGDGLRGHRRAFGSFAGAQSIGRYQWVSPSYE